MQRKPAIWRDSVLDRQPGKLMPESDLRPDGSHDPRLQALLQAVEQPAGEDLQQPKIDLAGHDGDRVQQSSRWAVQAGRARQYRVADRLGNPCATGREHFGDKERITARTPVQLLTIEPLTIRQLADRGDRERLELQPPGRGAPAHQARTEAAQSGRAPRPDSLRARARARTQPWLRACSAHRAWPHPPSARPRARARSGVGRGAQRVARLPPRTDAARQRPRRRARRRPPPPHR